MDRPDALTTSSIGSERAARIAAHLREHPDATANEIVRAVGGRKKEVLRTVRSLRERGTTQESGEAVATSGNRFPSTRMPMTVDELNAHIALVVDRRIAESANLAHDAIISGQSKSAPAALERPGADTGRYPDAV